MKPAVVFLCSGLNFPGGTERAIVNTAGLLHRNGHNVTLLILDKTDQSFYPVPAGIAVQNEALHFGITLEGNVVTRKISFVKHVARLRKSLKEIAAPVIIATDYVFAIAARVALKKKAFKIYAWEHHHFHWLQKNAFWKGLQQKMYPALDGVICLNKTEAELYNSIGCKTVVIPNFIEPQYQKAQLFQKTILTVGWLNRRKGVDLIPEIAEAVFAKFPDWHWTIIGEGEGHGDLKKLIQEKNLEAQVTILQPRTPDLDSHYLNTSLYVMPSRFECFPLVLLEAMAAGVPCVAFDCPTGPAHIIQNGVDGLLVEPQNVTAMIEAICFLIENEVEQKRMSAAAYENIKRFSPENIYELWQQLLCAE